MSSLPLKESASHKIADFPLACYQASSRFTSVPFLCKHHWHEEFEIIYLQKGSYSVEINMEKYQITQPCFCFIGSAELHALFCEKDYEESAIVFSPVLLRFSEEDPIQKHILSPLIDGQISILRFLSAEHPAFPLILTHYQHIKSLFPQQLSSGLFSASSISPTNQLYIRSDLLRILALLLDYDLLIKQSPIRDERVEIIKASLSFIHENYGDKIYLKDLASLAGLNEQYYSRFFKKMIGKSPMEYLTDYRIQQAKRFLLNTTDSVMEISLVCGFHNLGNFIQTFHKETGMTPLKFRQNHS